MGYLPEFAQLRMNRRYRGVRPERVRFATEETVSGRSGPEFPVPPVSWDSSHPVYGSYRSSGMSHTERSEWFASFDQTEEV